MNAIWVISRATRACVVVLLAAGCGDAAGQPTGSGRFSSTPVETATAAHAATARPAPTQTARETPEPSSTALRLELGTIDPQYTTPLLAGITDGSAIIWSSGAADGANVETAPDLYRFRPGVDAEPEMIWLNPNRDAALEPLDADADRYAFAERGTNPGDFWRFWLLPEAGGQVILLDDGNDGEDVPGFVPSFDLVGDRVVWTAFHAGPDGPLSQLWQAAAPQWTPQLIRSVVARERELWLPSMRGDRVAFVEVVYNADRTSDERHVLLLDLDDPAGQPQRLDTSGRATMPLLLDRSVIWKETAAGFNMFNWGGLVQLSLDTGEQSRVVMTPQEQVNYPSAGNRFLAAWGIDSSALSLHDLELGVSRPVLRYEEHGPDVVVRPHVGGDMLIVLHGVLAPDGAQAGPLELLWAQLPKLGGDR